MGQMIVTRKQGSVNPGSVNGDGKTHHNVKRVCYHYKKYNIGMYVNVRVRVFNPIFNKISVIWWQPDLLVEEAGVAGENYRPVASQ